MKDIIKKITPHFQQVRHVIHANPELCFEEKQTAKLIADELTKIGLSFQMGVGGTGIVAILDSGKPGKTVALRAEMDALPMQEENDVPYKSKHQGKMHACGHDGHTATLLATAYVLNQIKDQFSGKIKFIFQPAEEGGAGADAMIKAGVLENPKVDAIFAYHNHPGYEAGIFFTREGCALYSNTNFTFTLHGKGGHAATPDSVIDPIIIGAAIVQNLQSMVRQLSNPIDPTIISITQFISGTANNIIPDTAVLVGTVRSSSLENNARAKRQLQNLVQGMTQAYGAKVTIKFDDLYPPTINTRNETQLAFAVAENILGKSKTQIKVLPARASEDFAFFLQKIPGCYFFIGSGKDTPACHNSKFDFNDEVLPIAVELLCAVAINFVEK